MVEGLMFTRNQLFEDYCANQMSVRQICEKHGAKPSWVDKALRVYGIEKRKAGPIPGRYARENCPNWRDDVTNYQSLHSRISRYMGRPSDCRSCGATDPAIRYEWANLSGRYDDPSDYIRLCVTCHRRMDWNEGKRLSLLERAEKAREVRHEMAMARTHCQNGHEFTPGNTIIREGGTKRCRECYLSAKRLRRSNRRAA